MLQTVDVGKRSIEAYRGIVPDEIYEELIRGAEALRGARVAHVNATPYGGGVSELLRSVVPLLNNLGIVTEWKVISGDDEFFQVTKKVHNALQGAAEGLSAKEQDLYVANAQKNARDFEEQYDFVVIHDPQPAGMLTHCRARSARWIWRCHIDTSQPNAAVWKFLRGFLEGYEAAVFTMREFVPPDMPIGRVEIIPPAIDPLSPKNLDLSNQLARQILAWIGIEFDRPLVAQISRFDPWKDPFGVIEAYRLVRERVPNLQLALVGSMALDDPQGWDLYRRLQEESRRDPLIHLFTNLTGVSNVEVNAFQRLSNVIVQKSIREGFGLVVSEAMWKGTPVVAGRAGGIPLQMADGAGGILVDSVEECAKAIARLLEHASEAKQLAQRGRERVRRHFLLPRLLLDTVNLLRSLAPAPAAADARRDPVCGMAVDRPEITAAHAGRDYVFCSDECRNRFRKDPQKYAVPGSARPRASR